MVRARLAVFLAILVVLAAVAVGFAASDQRPPLYSGAEVMLLRYKFLGGEPDFAQVAYQSGLVNSRTPVAEQREIITRLEQTWNNISSVFRIPLGRDLNTSFDYRRGDFRAENIVSQVVFVLENYGFVIQNKQEIMSSNIVWPKEAIDRLKQYTRYYSSRLNLNVYESIVTLQAVDTVPIVTAGEKEHLGFVVVLKRLDCLLIPVAERSGGVKVSLVFPEPVSVKAPLSAWDFWGIKYALAGVPLPDKDFFKRFFPYRDDLLQAAYQRAKQAHARARKGFSSPIQSVISAVGCFERYDYTQRKAYFTLEGYFTHADSPYQLARWSSLASRYEKKEGSKRFVVEEAAPEGFFVKRYNAVYDFSPFARLVNASYFGKTTYAFEIDPVDAEALFSGGEKLCGVLVFKYRISVRKDVVSQGPVFSPQLRAVCQRIEREKKSYEKRVLKKARQEYAKLRREKRREYADAYRLSDEIKALNEQYEKEKRKCDQDLIKGRGYRHCSKADYIMRSIREKTSQLVEMLGVSSAFLFLGSKAVDLENLDKVLLPSFESVVSKVQAQIPKTWDEEKEARCLEAQEKVKQGIQYEDHYKLQLVGKLDEVDLLQIDGHPRVLWKRK